MTDQARVSEAAARLLEAELTRRATTPIRDDFDALDLDSAYAVQQSITDYGVAAGRRLIGRKIGLTNPVVQEQLGVNQPDFGALFADMAFPSGVDLPANRLIQPRAEAEIALVLGSDLARPDSTIVDLISATDYAVAALEIVDSRIENWDIRITDTIADNGSSGVFVIGNMPVPLSAVDVRAVEMSMSVNGEVVSEGTGAACLHNPLNAALWLVNEVARRGIPMAAGDIVLTGALGPMHPLLPGDHVRATITGLGTVSCRLPDRSTEGAKK
ncbi:MAG: 2-keto-4-pentenoate hydratase [Acidimicrobiales bacterium]|nr:2-keto-4-pentenoate hydratase [Acidimicrobiales bacterium]